MLHILYGNNIDEKLAELKKLVGETEPLRRDLEDFQPSELLELLGTSGLFDETHTIVMRDVFDEHGDFLQEHAQAFTDSRHTWILVENKLLKKEITKFTKAGAAITEFAAPVQKQPRDNFIFTLTDAFANRDKKMTWVLYQEALSRNLAPEEIHGVLFWQIKNMLMVASGNTNPGLHQFVYQKTKNFVKKFSLRELKKLSTDLVTVYHEARRGRDMKILLEKFLLAI